MTFCLYFCYSVHSFQPSCFYCLCCTLLSPNKTQDFIPNKQNKRYNITCTNVSCFVLLYLLQSFRYTVYYMYSALQKFWKKLKILSYNFYFTVPIAIISLYCILHVQCPTKVLEQTENTFLQFLKRH